VKDIWVDPLVKQYAASLVEATRQHEAVFLGASPRGSLALYRTSQAKALLDGRDYVLPDDAKALAYSVLGHRVIVSPAARLKGVTAEEVVVQCLESVPVPGVRTRRGP
jgi:MoxR-like ATPase